VITTPKACDPRNHDRRSGVGMELRMLRGIKQRAERLASERKEATVHTSGADGRRGKAHQAHRTGNTHRDDS
jgi:hypothetical protein